jgi:recombination associated protein RdgC
MWFKNLQIYTLPKNWNMSPSALEDALAPQVFQSCTATDMQTSGWVSPRENGPLVHVTNNQMLIRLGFETKLLPGSVITQYAKLKATEIEEQQGFRPGRKQMKEIKEQVTDELLPRAFSIQSGTWAWIDPVNGWLVVDSSSTSKADAVLRLLIKAIHKFPVEGLRVVQSPVTSMTSWLANDEVPHGFTIDQDTELVSIGESKAKVKYVRHTLEADDVRKHIAEGKQCTNLAMTWNDRISFVLTENLVIKRIAPLDILTETGTDAEDEEGRFNSDVVLMTGELNNFMSDIVAALGGVLKNN